MIYPTSQNKEEKNFTSVSYLGENMDGYDKEVCNLKHKVIEDRFREGKELMDEVKKKLDNLTAIAITTLISVITALTTVLGTYILK